MKIKGVVKPSPTIGGVATGTPSLSGTALPFGGKGDSAYEVAVKEGFEGSVEEWLESLKGEPYESYIHHQSTPAETWVVQHNLGRKANVQIVDSAGTLVLGETQHIDDNLLLIKFSAGFSGTAYVGG